MSNMSSGVCDSEIDTRAAALPRLTFSSFVSGACSQHRVLRTLYLEDLAKYAIPQRASGVGLFVMVLLIWFDTVSLARHHNSPGMCK